MNNKKSLTRETAAGRNNQVREGAARILFLAAACVSILAVLLITVFLLVSGVPAIAEIGVFKFLLGTVWKPGNDIYGILPMILGSLYVTSGALILGVPIGVLTAIFLSRFASKRMVSVVKPAVAPCGNSLRRLRLLWSRGHRAAARRTREHACSECRACNHDTANGHHGFRKFAQRGGIVLL